MWSMRPVSSGETRPAAQPTSPSSCPDQLSQTSLNFAGTHAVPCHHSARSTSREWNASIGMHSIVPVVFWAILVGAVAYVCIGLVPRPSLAASAPKKAGREGLRTRLCLHHKEVADAMYSRLHCTSHTIPTTKDPNDLHFWLWPLYKQFYNFYEYLIRRIFNFTVYRENVGSYPFTQVHRLAIDLLLGKRFIYSVCMS